MRSIYTEEDIQEMINTLPKDFIVKSIQNSINAKERGGGHKEEDHRLYEITKTLNDEFIDEIIMHNEAEYNGYDRDKDVFPDESDAKIVASYKKLIKKDTTKKEESLIISIGERIYTWRYAYKMENIDSTLIKQIYLYALLDEVFDEAREQSEMYLSD